MENYYDHILDTYKLIMRCTDKDIVRWIPVQRKIVNVYMVDGNVYQYDDRNETVRRIMAENEKELGDDESIIEEFTMKLNNQIKYMYMSQKELAYQLDVSEVTVSRWTLGKSLPNVTMLARICKVLNCTPNDLIPCVENGYWR